MKSCCSGGEDSHGKEKTNWVQIVAIGIIVLFVVSIALGAF
jgi:hypothetical protein